MALEDYTLQRLRKSVMDEFAIDSTDSTNINIIDAKINDAVAHICMAEDDWPWLLKEGVVDIPASTSVTGTFTKGSKTVSGVSPASTSHLRHVLFPDGSSTRTAGYQIVDITGSTYTLQSQWLGSDGSQTVSVGYHMFELPSDYRKFKSLSGGDNSVGTRFKALTQLEFLRTRNTKVFKKADDYFYTVLNDPIGKTGLQYLAIFPYINEQMTLFYNYWKSPAQLVEDTDIPVIPREERVTILQTTYWFFSNTTGSDPNKIAFYREQALESLQRMRRGKEYVTTPDSYQSVDDIGWIGPPPGYPPEGHWGI